jgi:hypothetical protein
MIEMILAGLGGVLTLRATNLIKGLFWAALVEK